MKKIGFTWFCMSLIICCSCQKELLEYEQGDIKVRIEKGDEWLHDFPVFLGINKKNAPQIAIWLEDTNGKYLSTVYVTHKIATQSWQAANGNRRKEALPHWCYARRVQYADGLYLPTKKQPFTDGITGATPQGSFDIKLHPTNELKQFIVKIEINHSTDFNDFYPKSAKEGDTHFSGGTKGSGQPAVIYAANLDLNSGKKSFDATIIGHSSPDGSDGNVVSDISELTTALHIVKHITIDIL